MREAEKVKIKEDQTKSWRNLNVACEVAQKLYYKISKVLRKFEDVGEALVGMGYGQCVMYHAGGVFKRTVNFAVGPSLSQA